MKLEYIIPSTCFIKRYLRIHWKPGKELINISISYRIVYKLVKV